MTTSGGALCRDLDDVPAKAEVALLAFRDYEVFLYSWFSCLLNSCLPDFASSHDYMSKAGVFVLCGQLSHESCLKLCC